MSISIPAPCAPPVAIVKADRSAVCPVPLVEWATRPTFDYPYGVIRIRMGKEVAYYDVAEVDCQFPNSRGFCLEKQREPNGCYHVCLCMTNPQDHTCECRGFLAHGHCRHIAAAILIAQTPMPVEPDTRPVPADAPF
jgi:hypothetical protein